MNGMTYEVFLYICYGAAALSAVFLILAIVLFFTMKIPSVVGDLTGSTARKAIAQIRSQSEAGGEKNYHPSRVNQERGQITDKISRSGNLLRNPSNKLPTHGTSKLNTGHLRAQAAADQVAADPGQTALLDQNQTTMLDQGQTTMLDSGQTAVLDSGQTTMLDQTAMPVQAAPVPVAPAYQPAPVFRVDYEITYIHTNEQIL